MTKVLHITDTPAATGTTTAAEAEAAWAVRELGARNQLFSLYVDGDGSASTGAGGWARARSTEDLSARIAGADLVHLHFWNTPRTMALLRQAWPACRLIVSIYSDGQTAPHVLTHDLAAFADVILIRMARVNPAIAFDYPADVRARRFAVVPPMLNSLVGPAEPRNGDGLRVLHAESSMLMASHIAISEAFGPFLGPRLRLGLRAGPGADTVRSVIADRLPQSADFIEFSQAGPADPLAGVDAVISSGEESPLSWNPAITRMAERSGIPVILFSPVTPTAFVVDNFNGFRCSRADELGAVLEYLRSGEAWTGGGADDPSEELLRIYRAAMSRPKTERAWGRRDIYAAGNRDITTAEMTSPPPGAEAAMHFVRSLGGGDQAFAWSLFAEAFEDAREADGELAQMAEKRGGELERCIAAHAQAKRHDPFLSYWHGVLLMRRGAMAEAFAAFHNAEKNAFAHWHLAWNQSLVALQLRRYPDAWRYLKRVLWFKPNYEPGIQMRRILRDMGAALN